MRDALNVPNLVSILRLLLVPLFIWLVVIDEIGWAGVLLGVIGATDWVDGYLARRLDQVTELGKLLDPVADRLAVAIAVIAGLLTGVLPAWLGWAIIVREIAVGIGALYGWTRGVRRLDVRDLGKLATLLLYLSVTAFYIGVGFEVRAIEVFGWLTGIPGVVLYYAVAVQYLGDLRTAITAAPAQGAAAADEPAP
jgi:cardiolipin synthase